ncbi:MAG: nucleoside deaminase [Rhodomicrobium sp.]
MKALDDAADRAMMARCIELTRIAVREGEYPFGSVIAVEGRIVAEAINSTVREGDVSRHAEVTALSLAQKSLARHELARATLYTSVEPCAMCSYCIREARICRVVYSLSSPIMGGHSKWNILRDREISSRIPIFGPAPEVVSGVLSREVRQVWQSWNPLAWEYMRLTGILTETAPYKEDIEAQAADRPTPWQRMTFAFMRLAHARSIWTRRA